MKKVLSLALVLVMLLGITVPVYAGDISDVTVTITNIKNTAEGVCVEWNKVEGADSYNIYRRAGGESEPSLIAANVTETIYTDGSAESGTYYMYFVSAVIGDNESEKAEGRLIKFLSIPTNVKLSMVSNGIKVEWDAVVGADSYRVYYRVKGAETWNFVASPKNTSCVVKPNVAGSTFEVTVISCSGLAYRSTFNQTGYSITQVNTPKITLIENCPEGIRITWNNVSNTCKYRVYRRAAGEKYWTYLETVTPCSYIDTTVKSNVYYTYTVVAEEDGHRSAVATSNPVIKHVKTPKLQAVANGTDGSYIRWETVAGATKYVICRRGAGETTWIQVGQVTSGNRFKDTTTMWGQYYRYTVVAHSGNYKSGFDKNGLVIKFLPLGGTWNNTVIFNFYKGAVNNARDKTQPGYVMKMWQNANAVTFTGSNRAFVSEFQKEFRNSVYSYADPYILRTYKGSTDSEECLPVCYADISQVKSATVARKGGNYFVKLVFKDMGTPTDKNLGVLNISPMFYDMKDVANELYRQGYLTSYTTNTVYKDCAISAEITPDGRLVNMTHMIPCHISGSMNFVGDIGTVKCSGKMICYGTYSSFQY